MSEKPSPRAEDIERPRDRLQLLLGINNAIVSGVNLDSLWSADSGCLASC